MASRMPNRTKGPGSASASPDDLIAQDEADVESDQELEPIDEEEEDAHALAPAITRDATVASAATVSRRPWPDYLPRWIPSYLREALSELEKVAWPARREAINLTAMVIALALVFAALFGLVDLGLGNAVTALAKHLTGK